MAITPQNRSGMEDLGLDGSLIYVPEKLRAWQLAGIQYYIKENPVDWPHPWNGFFQKAPSAPVFLLTYWELGIDLSGRGDKARSLLWRKIIKALSLPSGMLCFWPPTEFDGTDLTANLDMFHRGLRHFSPNALFCFGKKALDNIFPKIDQQKSLHQLDLFQLLILPSPKELLESNRLFETTIDMLHKYIHEKR